MTWRDHVWEFVITVFSWIIAIGVFALVVLFAAFTAFKERRSVRR